MRVLTAGILAVALAGCSDPVDNDFDGLVEVVADVKPEGTAAVVTIRNDSPEIILLQPCGVGLEYRGGDEWQGLSINCLALLTGPTRIDAGDELVLELPFGLFSTQSGESIVTGSPPRLRPGEYRFGAALMNEDEKPLSEDARTSDVFRIDP